MANTKGRPPDDVSSAPESGTVCDDTSGNRPAADRGIYSGQSPQRPAGEKDDPADAGAER
jgi:hypothetical protein